MSANPSTIDGIFARLEHLNAVGAALSSERNLPRLLETILLTAKSITGADGGTLYRVSEDGQRLRFEILRTDSLGVAFGGSAGAPLDGRFPDVPLRHPDGSPNNNNIAAYCAINSKTVTIADAYTAEGFDFSGTRKFDAGTGYRSRSFLTVPMVNHEGEVIGVLQLLNAIDPASGEVVTFSDADQRLAESLASQAAVALTNRLLINQLEELFESFIALINTAIDEKSPYTAGHCQRVPVLTMMLAEAVNDTHRGPLSSFSMTDRDRYELKIAGLLHDCGKVTTPVHVVDKATKLHTLYDRIGLIDTRFEVLKRDAEIACLKAQLAGEDKTAAEARLADTLARIEADRAFLRTSNLGGERMSDEDVAHVEAIASGYRWRGPDGIEADFLDANERENLSIRAGTLTNDERQIINNHIVATIKMLNELPWPKHLKNVPEYAGGHHERMDGKGYPKGLTREQMSVQARVMGIADIFEALTARDRPYKPGLKLSESLTILGNMCKGGHVDPDLFDAFIRQKVYLKYAQEYLDERQVDEVDETKIPGYQP
jgi:HD-GYP domain-containing protein (c-di-GMP phosphodiesterase class II)